MSCTGCKKAKVDGKKDKIRKLAERIAKLDGKTQIIVEREGNLFIECEKCWEKGGRTGRAIEYFIV